MNVHLEKKHRVKPRDLYVPNDDEGEQAEDNTLDADSLYDAAMLLNDYGSKPHGAARKEQAD